MQFDDENEVLAEVRASAGRRALGIASLLLLAVVLLWVALAHPPAPLWQLFVIAVAAAALWAAQGMYRATASRIELTPLELRDADGTVIARTADIQSIDRGFFAFKPSNGFLLKTTGGGGRTWRPGMWWRLGNRVGIGGMTPGSQTKFMSEIISAMIATRTENHSQN